MKLTIYCCIKISKNIIVSGLDELVFVCSFVFLFTENIDSSLTKDEKQRRLKKKKQRSQTKKQKYGRNKKDQEYI